MFKYESHITEHSETYFTLATNVRDRIGRELSAVACIDKPARVSRLERQPDGTLKTVFIEQEWAVHVSAQRAGRQYGAYRYPTYVSTLEGAQMMARAKLKAVSDRIRRNAVKNNGIYRTARS